jgi:hypothetical protein
MITPSQTSEFDVDFRLGVVCVQSGPTLVLRDLLGHSSVLVTEKYLRRLDTTRIYRKAYDQAGIETGLSSEGRLSRRPTRSSTAMRAEPDACHHH